MIFLKIWVIIKLIFKNLENESVAKKNISISNCSLSYLTEKYQVRRHELLSNIIKYHHQILVPFEVFREAEVEKNVHQKRPCFALINISSRPQQPCGRWWDASLFTFSFIAVTSWLGSEDEIGGHNRFFDYPISNLIAWLFSAVIAQRLKIERH